ncbi:hypothetical protein YTPLAS21_03050 [Candidatus Nitrosocosmicus sp.]|nr:hypothetical protein YTPLAS21_03050 [Candidatus Nitrosocosmicus sp.]
MSKVSVDEETKKRVIEKRKAGVSMRIISKEDHLSFTTINKIWNEIEGPKDPKADKSVTSRAFELFENNNLNLVQVTIELHLNPAEAEKIHKSYLRLKGLDKLFSYCEKADKHLPSFLDFIFACEQNTPEGEKITEILHLQKVIESQMRFKWDLMTSCHDYEKRLAKARQEEEATKQRIEKLKQEAYNTRYGLYGNPNNYSTNQ